LNEGDVIVVQEISGTTAAATPSASTAGRTTGGFGGLSGGGAIFRATGRGG